MAKTSVNTIEAFITAAKLQELRNPKINQKMNKILNGSIISTDGNAEVVDRIRLDKSAKREYQEFRKLVNS